MTKQNLKLTEEQVKLALFRMNKQLSLFSEELKEVQNIEDENERFVRLMDVIEKVKQIGGNSGDIDEKA